MDISAGTIARTICLLLALCNQILAIFGREAFQFAETEIYQLCSLLFTTASSVAAWWKNNSFTKPAIEADCILTELRK